MASSILLILILIGILLMIDDYAVLSGLSGVSYLRRRLLSRYKSAIILPILSSSRPAIRRPVTVD
jgi:hypothetical protein